MMKGLPTCRYRGNFFVLASRQWSEAEVSALANDLSSLYVMPVKFEGEGQQRRCLELVLQCSCPPRVLLGFRTDMDRQGESRDVTAWPPRLDPRAHTVCRSLVLGLVSKFVAYSVPGVKGLPATIRKAYQFLKKTRYPRRWWIRPFLYALLRHGVGVGLLPKGLRFVAG